MLLRQDSVAFPLAIDTFANKPYILWEDMGVLTSPELFFVSSQPV